MRILPLFPFIAFPDALFLAEDQFAVRDLETEKKYNFKLAQAIENARDLRGNLFDGHTFYVTRGVISHVAYKIVQKVVQICGGKVRLRPHLLSPY